MNYQSSYRKFRRLKFLVKRLGKTEKHSHQFRRLLRKIQSLTDALRSILPLKELTKALGMASMFITLSVSSVNAQQFTTHVPHAFGMGVGSEILVCPSAADLDGDGDYDLMGGNKYGAIQYQRNSGSATNPVFDAPMSSPFGLATDTSTYWVNHHLVDIDNDGDFDLFSGEFADSANARFIFFENIGTSTNPSFASPVINPFNLTNTDYLSSPNLADIDGDGDMDLFSSTTYTIQFFENIGTASNPNFKAPVTDPYGISIPTEEYIYAADLADIDQDGDLDLIANEYYGDFYYFQNTGTATSPNFAAVATNPLGLTPAVPQGGYSYTGVEAVDIDGDGDLDIIAGRYDDITYEAVWYYENVAATSSVDDQLNNVSLKVFPNPTSSWLNVSADLESEVNISLYDLAGKAVIAKESVLIKDNLNLNVSHLASGSYFLKLETAEGRFTSKKVSIIR